MDRGEASREQHTVRPRVIPDGRSTRSRVIPESALALIRDHCKLRTAFLTIPESAYALRDLITRMCPPIPSWPPLRRPSRKTQGIPSYNWMAGSSPAMTVERKFANVFMAASASGNILIKFRDEDSGERAA